jgi:TonB-linked SusC/RagA family outer membrane protein
MSNSPTEQRDPARSPGHSGYRAAFLRASLLVLLLFPTANLLAQESPAAVPLARRPGGYQPLDVSRELPAALARPVTLRVRDMPLEWVLEAIAQQARLGISYGEDVVRAKIRVTVELNRVSAAQALAESVRGTPWQVLYTLGGQVTLIPRTPSRVRPGSIAGRVSDSDGHPLPGASVSVPGTQLAARTRADGSFDLRGLAPGAYTLRVTSPGYDAATRTSIVVAGQTAASRIQLKEKVIQLEELVAIGYGTARRRDLTGSVATVRARELEAGSGGATAVSSALLGRAPGVQVVSNLGTPGASAVLQVRGANSISALPDPLYVLDGIPLSPAATPLNSIDTDNVESVQILKDASATAIYGARGANGVVLITTKRGTRGRDQVTIESSYGLQQPTRFIPALNASDFMQLVNEGLVNAGGQPRYSDAQIAGAPSFDYPRAMLQGLQWQPQQSHGLTVSGGDERTRYLLSGSLVRQEGIVLNSGFQRVGTRFNLDRNVSRLFRAGASIAGARSVQRVNGAESSSTSNAVTGMTAALMFDPSVPPRDPVTGEWNQRIVLNERFWNPVAESTERRNPIYNTTLLASFYGEYDLAKGLLLRSTLAGNFNFGRSFTFSPSTIGTGNGTGTATQSSAERRELTNENTLSYRAELGPGRLELLAGATAQTSHFEVFTAEARGFPTDAVGYNNLGAGTQVISPTSGNAEWALLSGLGRLNYNLLDRYLFTITGRRDGSSRFGANNKWAVFPSAAFAWRAIDEPMLRRQRIFSDLKLRLSYGRTGNQAIDPYQSLAQLSPVFFSQGTGTDVVTLAPTSAAPNPDLKWETQDQLNAGLDLGFRDNRVSLTVDAYQSRTSNLLLRTTRLWTTGFDSQLRNVGAVRNRGVELGLTTVNWERGRLSWWTTLNLSANRNEVAELYGGLRALGAGSSTQVGEPLNTFVGYKVLGLYQAGDPCPIMATRECAPGEYHIQDTNGDGVINDNDRVNLGNAQARFYGGFNSNLRYGALAVDAFFNFSQGNHINNSSMRYLGLVGGASNERADRSLARWTPAHTDTDVPRANILRPNNRTYSTYVEDGSFLRLQTLAIGCEIPTGWVPGRAVEAARVTLTGQNLWITTRYSGFDPEQQAVDPGGYPRARSWNVAMNLAF